jgi:hypothetical protein
MIDKITWHAEELASQCGRIVYHILVNIHFSRHLILLFYEPKRLF